MSWLIWYSDVDMKEASLQRESSLSSLYLMMKPSMDSAGEVHFNVNEDDVISQTTGSMGETGTPEY